MISPPKSPRQGQRPPLPLGLLVQQYQNSKTRLLIFDYDGTLTPIVQNPEDATLSEEMMQTLRELLADANNIVWIVSGRDEAFLEKHLGHLDSLGLVAEHGGLVRGPSSAQWHNITDGTDMSWQERVMPILEKYANATPGARIECKKIGIAWHYQMSFDQEGWFQSVKCWNDIEDLLGPHSDIEVIQGKALIEVRPRFVNKGSAVKDILAGAVEPAPDFVLCLGDDNTDEDMFNALKLSAIPQESVFTCYIGDLRTTSAKWRMPTPNDVAGALKALVQTEMVHR